MLLANILKKLQYSEGFLSAEHLAKELSVSKRTIQNRIQLLNKEGAFNGFSINSSYGKGYYLKIINSKKFLEFYKSLFSEFDVKNEKNLIMLELEMLIERGSKYLTVETLANKLMLSKTYLFSKMDILEKYLKIYNLCLVRKSHYGLKIDGSEEDILRLINDLYSENKGIYILVNKTVNNFKQIDNSLKTYFRKEGFEVNYYQYHSTLNLIKCFIFYKLKFVRTKTKKIIFNKKLDIVNKINIELIKDYSIQINKQDAIALKKLNTILFPNREQINFNKSQLEKDLVNFINKIDKSENTNFSTSKIFITKLTNHLISLFNRINKNITYKNPMLMTISVKYPLIFDITLRFYLFLKKKYGYEISNDELGFIALYFLSNIEDQRNKEMDKLKRIAIICTTGGILSEITKKRINKIFSKARIVTFSFYDSKKIIRFRPNLILSMVPMFNNCDVPIIYISELLSNKDLEEIKERLFINEKDTKYTEVNYINFIKPELVKLYKPTVYLNILRLMSQTLVEHRYANSDIVRNVMMRERLMSTIYKNGIAIPHSIKMNARVSTISIGIVQPELVTHLNNVKLIFLINLTDQDKNCYSSISNAIYKLMNKKYEIQKIIESPNYEAVINVLKNVEI